MTPAQGTPFQPKEGSVESYIDLTAIHDFAVNVALRAGAVLRQHTLQRAAWSRSGHASSSALSQSDEKESQIDIVTKVDVLLEDFIRAEIEKAWPGHEVVAEESFGRNGDVKQSWKRNKGPRWFIDPLDGTLNATHLFPLHCISIGFACSHDHIQHGRVVDDALVGAIFAPSMGATGTLWSGARGHGAFLSNPLRLPGVSKAYEAVSEMIDHGCLLAQLRQFADQSERGDFSHVQRLPLVCQPLPAAAPSGILFASEWGKDRRIGVDGKGNLARKMKTMTSMAAKEEINNAGDLVQIDSYVHGVRSLGSSTLDLAFVAQGSIDVLWEGGCWEWDVCAGIALLLESGGFLTDSNPPSDKTSAYWTTAISPRAELGARRFLAVRSCAPTATETASDAQLRVARQVWSRTDGLDYYRPGVTYEVEERSFAGHVKSAAKLSSSVRDWQADALRERKRLTKEEAQQLAQNGGQEALEQQGTFGGRLLNDEKNVWDHNAWDHVEPPAEYTSMVQEKLAAQRETQLSAEAAEAFHRDPAAYWNDFYSQHEHRFFKERRWLHLEFPELIAASKADAGPIKILEVGCGAGNTVFPLLEVNQNAQLHIYACDYSSEAVKVVQSNPLYIDPPCGQCTAEVWDLSACTSESDEQAILPAGLPPHSLDIVVLIFVLSALHPREWQRALNNVRHCLKPGGLLLVRDYGRHDLPQVRFGKNRMLDDNFYLRGDGTRVYFFTPDELLHIFNASRQKDDRRDFHALQLAVDRRMLLNRKEKKQMFRNWIQAKFQRCTT